MQIKLAQSKWVAITVNSRGTDCSTRDAAYQLQILNIEMVPKVPDLLLRLLLQLIDQPQAFYIHDLSLLLCTRSL